MKRCLRGGQKICEWREKNVMTIKQNVMNSVVTHCEQKRNGCDKLEYEMEGEYLLPYVALE